MPIDPGPLRESDRGYLPWNKRQRERRDRRRLFHGGSVWLGRRRRRRIANAKRRPGFGALASAERAVTSAAEASRQRNFQRALQGALGACAAATPGGERAGPLPHRRPRRLRVAVRRLRGRSPFSTRPAGTATAPSARRSRRPAGSSASATSSSTSATGMSCSPCRTTDKNLIHYGECERPDRRNRLFTGRYASHNYALRASARTASRRAVAPLNEPLTMLGGSLAARISSFSTGLSQSGDRQENAVMESHPTGLEAQRLLKGLQLSITVCSP